MIVEAYDSQQNAIISPNRNTRRVEDFPDTVVAIFSRELFYKTLEYLDGEEIASYHDVDGVWPIYKVKYKGRDFAFVKGRMSAPVCVASFEDVLCCGAKRLILLGNCGTLDKKIEDCSIIIPNKAFREEGTSYHYAPPSESIDVNTRYRDLFKSICEERDYCYVEGATWTTDGFYRETQKKFDKFKAKGAICVDMECAAVQAFCNFRDYELFQFFYAADNLDGPVWDPRSLRNDIKLEEKSKIALLAFELALRIETEGSGSPKNVIREYKKIVLPDGEIYEGDVVNGKLTGKGKMLFPDEAIYMGDFVDGKFHGRGSYTFGGDFKGDIYTGEFKNNYFFGKGELKFASGHVYRGDFLDSQLNGLGIMDYSDGSCYVGEFEQNKKWGMGFFRYANGSIYTGQFVNNKKSGYGQLRYANGEYYKGEFFNDVFSGHGTFMYKDGSYYIGEFAGGIAIGRGEIRYPNGDVYVGEVVGAQRKGKGEMRFASGDVYIGEFKDDKIYIQGE